MEFALPVNVGSDFVFEISQIVRKAQFIYEQIRSKDFKHLNEANKYSNDNKSYIRIPKLVL